MKRILVATDGSPSATDAVAFGVELAAEHASELFGAGVNVDQPLRRHRYLQERIAGRGDLAEPRTDHEMAWKDVPRS